MSLIEIYNLADMPKDVKERIMKRAEGEIEEILPNVEEVVKNVRENGDKALFDYMKRFDKVKLTPKNILVTKDEIKEAYEKADPKLVDSLKQLVSNVKKFHDLQKPSDWMTELSPGLVAGQVVIPIKSVGCYTPGGRGWFPSTVLMTVLPAKAAGVEKVIVCSPPKEDGTINEGVLVAADLCGADAIFKLSGAQAIAAMAYGTESVPKMDKIVGPGGQWVVAAKRVVRDDVGIDMPAGPGEGLILADERADYKFAAADVLIQAEHGNDSTGVIVTPSRKLAEKAQKEAERLFEKLPEYRQEFVRNSLAKYGAIIVTKDMDEAIDFVNEYVVEHLEVMTENPMQVMKRIRNAGAFYLGDYSPLSAGCFCSGPNHTLPTSKYGKVYGGLKTEDFLKKVSFEFPTKEGLGNLKEAMLTLADYEGFPAHGNAIRVRFDEI